jgi:hypothetical protein
MDRRSRIHRDLIIRSSAVKALSVQEYQSLHQGENSNLSFLSHLAKSGPFSGPIFICPFSDAESALFQPGQNLDFQPAGYIRWSAIFIASFSKLRFSAFKNAL